MSFLDPIFRPLLALGPFWAVVIISLLVSLLITFVYKWMTDQHLMKSLKDEIKQHQEEMKKHSHDTAKVMEIQKKAMTTNMEYMKHSMKPTLVTMLPLLLILGWFNSNMVYAPIMPGEEFRIAAVFESGVTGSAVLEPVEGVEVINGNEQQIAENKAVWILKADKGSYFFEINYKDKKYPAEVLITDEQAYSEPVKTVNENGLESIKVNNEKLVVMNLLGWKLGWLGTYIIISLISSLALRKALGIN